MDNTFDDLFNKFFGESPKKPSRRKGAKKEKPTPPTNLDKPNNNDFPTIPDEIKRIMGIVEDFTKGMGMNSMDENMEKKLDKSLGKPDKIEFYEDNGRFIEKRIWHTPNGDMVKILVTDDPSLLSPRNTYEKPLESQLKDALANEEYEKAAAIRDKIAEKKMKSQDYIANLFKEAETRNKKEAPAEEKPKKTRKPRAKKKNNDNNKD